MSFESTVQAKSIELTRLSYEMTAAAGSGHPTSAASLAHIVIVLMYQHMRWEPANPGHISSDRLVLSEGHAVPIVYAACADMGVGIARGDGTLQAMSREDAMALREIGSVVDGHPNPAEGFPFFDAATGSLGQGLSVGAGLAAAAKLDQLDKRVFVIIGDGESREGQIWEALDFIRDYNLKAVCPIFNCNDYGQSDKVSDQQSAQTIARKLEAVGFNALTINGHAPEAIIEALNAHGHAIDQPNAAPVAIVANTVKGWASPSQQGHGHHGKAVEGDELAQALADLEQTGRQVGALADSVFSRSVMPIAKPVEAKCDQVIGLQQACQRYGLTEQFEKGSMATRRAYGLALHALGEADSRIVALDADVKNSTFAEDFCKDEQLAGRFFECRIAEQNMVSVAVGLSAAGRRPFVSTFGKFFTRAYDQIEMAVNSGANFKLTGSHAGITLAADGPSQMALPDVAWFRSFTTVKNHKGNPAFYVLQPSDAYQAYALTVAMAEYDGPVYMRTLRPNLEFLYGPDNVFKLGGHEVLTEGRDLLIVASGYMVHEANKALNKLDAQGIDATLVDLYSLPFDEEAILDLANANNGIILTIEDNYGGAMGSAVADTVLSDGGGFTISQMFVRRIPKSGKTPADVLDYCGLSNDNIVEQAMSLLQLTGT